MRRSPAGLEMDLEEVMQLEQVRSRTRLWRIDDLVIGFAFVDHYGNLFFEMDPVHGTIGLENEIAEWGMACVRKRDAEAGEENTLDACVEATDAWRIAMLERLSFERAEIRTLRFSRRLDLPVIEHPLPPGFSLRCARGEDEVEALVELHRAAFGTDHMTVEERFAIMRAPQYERELDLVAMGPGGDLAAFCICGLRGDAGQAGYTDPIGVRRDFQNLGLGKAIVTAGLKKLQGRGAKIVELGTSSDNFRMQRLAESLGFALASERLWYTKRVDRLPDSEGFLVGRCLSSLPD